MEWWTSSWSQGLACQRATNAEDIFRAISILSFTCGKFDDEGLKAFKKTCSNGNGRTTVLSILALVKV